MISPIIQSAIIINTFMMVMMLLIEYISYTFFTMKDKMFCQQYKIHYFRAVN